MAFALTISYSGFEVLILESQKIVFNAEEQREKFMTFSRDVEVGGIKRAWTPGLE